MINDSIFFLKIFEKFNFIYKNENKWNKYWNFDLFSGRNNCFFLDIFYTEYDDDCTSSQFKKTAFHITLILHHLLISFIILVCFFSTNKNLLLFVLILCIFIFIQWKLFSICIITSASKKLCNGKYKWKITNIINNLLDIIRNKFNSLSILRILK